MHLARRFVLLLLFSVAAGLASSHAAEGPATPPASEAAEAPGDAAARLLKSREAEARAERLERRDELLSAQMEYGLAWSDAAAVATFSGDPATWARAEVLLEKAVDLAEQTGNTEAALASLQPERLQGMPHLLQDRAAWHRARLLLRQGKADEARTAADALDLLRAWTLIGPLDNERGRGFDLVLPPEKLPLDLAQTLAGCRRPVAFRHHLTRDPLGFVNLATLFLPNEECLAYAVTRIKSPKRQIAALRLGSDDGIAAWFNGQEVLRQVTDRQADLDQTVIGVQLEEGWNVLVLKVAQSTGAWGFYARLTAPDGGPLNLEIEQQPLTGTLTAPPGAAAAELPEIDQGALSYLAGAIQQDRATPRELYYLGYLLERRSVFGSESQLSLQLLRRAMEEEPQNGLYVLALARAADNDGRSAPDREENHRRLALGRARELGAEEVAATVDLAAYYFRSMANRTRATELLHEALNANPLSFRAQRLLAEIQLDRGWTAQAVPSLRRSMQQSGSDPRIRLALAKALRQGGELTAALEAIAEAVRLHAVDPEIVREQIALLEQTGRNEEALARIQAYLRLQPYDLWAKAGSAGLLRGLERYTEALAAIDARLTDCPEDHEAHALRGELLHALGRADDARAAWERALALQPNFPRLRRYLQALGTAEERDAPLEDLAAYIEANADWQIPAGAAKAYLVDETINRLGMDGTRSETRHYVARALERQGADDLRQAHVFFNPDVETVTVHAARLLRPDGSTAEAQEVRRDYATFSVEFLTFPALEPGDVVEVKYSIDRFRPDFFGDYFGRIHVFQKDAPVRRARFVLIAPPGRPVYFHRTGGAPEAVEAREEKTGALKRAWEMTDLAAIEQEPSAPPDEEIAPAVQVSTFRDWNALARWYWHLIKGQHLATEEIRRKVHELTAGLGSDEEKVRAIYQWVTHEIRNVAWSFGVHGFKPYSADTIFTRRFGDCKDKATLMNVMLREIGLEGWPVLVEATDASDRVGGRGREDFTLPLLAHFNHCITRVEADGKVFFLDGTIPHRTADLVPQSISGAQAVVVGPDGALLTQIPAHDAGSNLWDETLAIALDENGDAEIGSELRGRGSVSLLLRAYFSRPDVRNLVFRRLAGRYYGECTAADVSRCEPDPELPDAIRLDARAYVREFAKLEADGSLRLKLPTAWLRGNIGKGSALPDRLRDFAPYSTRLHDVVLPLVFRMQRRVLISWPESYRLAGDPPSARIELPFGALKVDSTVVGDTLRLEYLLEWSAPRVPVAQYPDFRRLCILADRIDSLEIRLEKE